MSVPAVPGVTALRLLDGREAWRGRSGREPVDVTVLVVPPEADLRRAASAALTPLVGPAVGALPACRAVVTCRDGVALVADAVDGRPLASMPPLAPGHAVTVGMAVAQAMRALHARGIAWGGDLGELLVDDTGTVRLPYEAAAGRRVGGRPAGPRDDVRALCRLLAARCPDPRLRALADVPPSDVGALVRRLRRIARPRPLLLGDAVAPSTSPTRRLPARAALLGGAAALALVGAALLGWGSAAHTAASAPDLSALPLRAPARTHAAVPTHAAAKTPPAGTKSWTAVLASLDEARAAALDGTGTLAAADASGSPAALLDASTRAALVERRLSVHAPAPVVGSIRTVSASATTATLVVSDTLPAYDYRDPAGHVVDAVAARPAHRWTVVLVRTAAGWRLSAVR